MTVDERIAKTIKEHSMFDPGDHLVVGFSGGPDSLCLLDCLMQMRQELGITIECVHVNHGFRGHRSDADQIFCETYCGALGIACHSYKINCKKLAKKMKMTSEEAGRKARYDSFREAAEQIAAGGIPREKIKIITAHNAGDQAETVLFRIFRGTGPDGLAGMRYMRWDERSGFIIARPLLDTPRAEIEEYCRSAGLKPRIDHTNEETDYGRNKIRLNIIPYIDEEMDANASRAAVRLSKLASEDKDYLDEVTQAAFDEAVSEARDMTGSSANLSSSGGADASASANLSSENLDASASENTEPSAAGPGTETYASKRTRTNLSRWHLKELHPAIRHRVILLAFKKEGLSRDIGFVHLEQAEKIIMGDSASGKVDFPGGYAFCVSYGIARVEPPQNKDDASPEIGVSARISDIDAEDIESLMTSGACVLDADLVESAIGADITNNITIRLREKGDYIMLKGGRKSMQDLMVDMKVSRFERGEIYLVSLGHEVLWIPRIAGRARYAEKYKISADSKRVLILEIENRL